MGTMIDYLNWRGDLTFAERPFCDVDNLVFAQLTYLDFSGIIPSAESSESILLGDALDQFMEQGRQGVGAVQDKIPGFAQALKNSRRFSSLRVSRFAGTPASDSETDFSAMQITLDDDTVFAAFRGTGDLLVGWQEDFSMSFQIMPAQALAAEYLRNAMEATDKKFYVGGHSKGGNLAVWAAIQQRDELKDRILKIYSNDGPGFCEDIIDLEKFNALQDRIVHIVPEFCVVGELFSQHFTTTIVKSSASGILQHDAMTWQIEGTEFVCAEALDRDCQIYNQIIDQWIGSADLEQRRTFTRDFFTALASGGATKLSEVSQSGVSDFGIILVSVANSEKPTKVMALKFLRSVGSAFKHIDAARLIQEKKLLQGIILFIIGIFLAVETEFAAQIIGIGVGIALVVWLGNKLLAAAFNNKDTIEAAKVRVVMYEIAICIVMYLIAQRSLLLQFSNLILAACFLSAAYRFALKCVRKTNARIVRGFSAVIGAITFCMGMIPILFSSFPFARYMFMSGLLITLFGVGAILQAAYISSNHEYV